MNDYSDLNNDSNILEYECGNDWIDIKYKSGGTYRYSSSIIGGSHLAIMKELAESGSGLNRYMNQNLEVMTGYTERR